MTLDDLLARESIRRTLAAYNIFGDRLRADEIAATFTQDGILESKGVPPGQPFRHEGREAIRAWFAGWDRPVDRPAPVRAPRFVRHNLTTCRIDLTGADTARARTYWAVFTDVGPDHCGCYVDTFRKVGEHWLIAHRDVRVDWKSADSFYR